MADTPSICIKFAFRCHNKSSRMRRNTVNMHHFCFQMSPQIQQNGPEHRKYASQWLSDVRKLIKKGPPGRLKKGPGTQNDPRGSQRASFGHFCKHFLKVSEKCFLIHFGGPRMMSPKIQQKGQQYPKYASLLLSDVTTNPAECAGTP